MARGWWNALGLRLEARYRLDQQQDGASADNMELTAGLTWIRRSLRGERIGVGRDTLPAQVRTRRSLCLQGDHRVCARRAARRDEAGERRDHEQQHRDRREGERIGRAHPEEE